MNESHMIYITLQNDTLAKTIDVIGMFDISQTIPR